MMKEREAEIERLKAQIETERRHYAEDSRDLIELTALLSRAADALEIWIAQADYITATIPEQHLIAELRKAAE